MTTITSHTPEIYKCHKDDIDNHQYVKSWKENPDNFDSKIRAYIVRDYCFRPNQDMKEMFEAHCKKTRIVYTEETRIRYLRQDFFKMLSNIMNNNDFPNMEIAELAFKDIYLKFMEENSHKYTGDTDRYRTIMDLVNRNTPLFEIYSHFTGQELDCIGW